jgi:hypothetical protein
MTDRLIGRHRVTLLLGRTVALSLVMDYGRQEAARAARRREYAATVEPCQNASRGLVGGAALRTWCDRVARRDGALVKQRILTHDTDGSIWNAGDE